MIRKALEKDLKAVRDIACISFPGKRPLSWFRKYLKDDFITYEENRTIEGFAILKGELFILVAVHPDFRRKGIGTSLMKHLIEKHPIMFLRVRENRQEAIAFYESIGFRKEKILPGYYSNKDNAVEMRLGS